jgi:DoxX-like family
MTTPSFGTVARPGMPFGKPAKYQVRIGLVLTVLAVLFLLMDAVTKLLALPNVLTTTALLGYPGTPDFARFLGVVLLVCTLLYAWPRTAPLGAILLTAYLGGAIASHVRVGSPLFTHILFGVYVALLVWGGLFLRDRRTRDLFS